MPKSKRRAARWLGPAVDAHDASIGAGVGWYLLLMAALSGGAVIFGALLTVVAAIGAWQAVGVRCRATASTSKAGTRSNRRRTVTTASLSERDQLPASALAGAVVLAGIIDTRLAGAVVAAAVGMSFIVAGALRSGSDPNQPGSRLVRLPPEVLARAGMLVRTWVHVGVTGACLAAVAQHSLGAALVLVTAASAYDAASYLGAAGRPPGLRGPFAGAFAAAAVIFAMTGLSIPPFAPWDAVRFGVLAAVTLPFGPAAARPITMPAVRPNAAGSDADGSGAAGTRAGRSGAAGSHGPTSRDPNATTKRRLLRGSRANSEWAVRRLDSLTFTALAWMWGLGIVTI